MQKKRDHNYIWGMDNFKFHEYSLLFSLFLFYLIFFNAEDALHPQFLSSDNSFSHSPPYKFHQIYTNSSGALRRSLGLLVGGKDQLSESFWSKFLIFWASSPQNAELC